MAEPQVDFLSGNSADGTGFTACYSASEIQIASMMGEWLFQNQTYKILSGTTNSDLQNTLMSDFTMNNGFGFMGASFPHLMALIFVIVVVARILHFCLHRLKLSQIVCQLIAGILVFSFLPRTKHGLASGGGYEILNPKIRRVEHVVGSIGILFNLFIAGVKFDPIIMFQPGKKKTIIIGLASAIIPFMAGSCMYALQPKQLDAFVTKEGNFLGNVLYPFCVTFPVTLTDTLTELGLLNSELGRLAQSSSMIQFLVIYWLFDVPFVVMKQGKVNVVYGLVTLCTFFAIAAFIYLVVRPYARHIVRSTPSGSRVKDVHIFLIMIVVLALAVVSDLAGFIFVDGPVFMGLVLPQGAPLGTALVERVDLVASEVLLPIVFMHEGFLFDWAGLKQNIVLVLRVEFIMLVAFLVKILTNIAVAMYYKMSFKDGLVLGLIMNLKGLTDMLLFLSFTSEQHLMDNTAFTAVVLSSIVITVMCVPLVSICYKPLGAGKKKGLRRVQHIDSHDELRMMSCFYDNKSVPALLEFLESVSSPLTDDRICMYILRIVELQGAAESNLISHRSKDGSINSEQMDLVHNHFISFEQTKRGVTIMPFTSVAPRRTMHGDVCSLILERNIALVIVPFPSKNSMADLETDLAMRDLVPLVLHQAPCSVGIMVYHGTTRIMMHKYWQYHVSVIFWGGPDDREAVAIASRLARHPSVYLSVSCFITSGKSWKQEDNDTEKASDDEVIAELRAANAGNDRMAISEITIENVEQAFSELHALGDLYDLLIVGRKQEQLLHLSEGLTELSESPELGVIGEMLASEISCVTNLLVVQQHKL